MKLVVANWKAYVTDVKAAEGLARAVAAKRLKNDTRVVLCPPFTMLSALAKPKKFSLGAQNVFWKASGPFTGEVTTEMLANFGVRYVIVGHSERRRHFGETNEIVAEKLQAVLAERFQVVLCVGEETRDDARAIPAVVGAQVKAALKGVAKNDVANVTVAYEPVWAIGTGIPDTPDDALSAAIYIRKVVSDLYDAKTAAALKVLYGGSVNSRNVKEFTDHEGINGVLVGKASTEKGEFLSILDRI